MRSKRREWVWCDSSSEVYGPVNIWRFFDNNFYNINMNLSLIGFGAWSDQVAFKCLTHWICWRRGIDIQSIHCASIHFSFHLHIRFLFLSVGFWVNRLSYELWSIESWGYSFYIPLIYAWFPHCQMSSPKFISVDPWKSLRQLLLRVLFKDLFFGKHKYVLNNGWNWARWSFPNYDGWRPLHWNMATSPSFPEASLEIHNLLACLHT
jgi:hypothetical protein